MLVHPSTAAGVKRMKSRSPWRAARARNTPPCGFLLGRFAVACDSSVFWHASAPCSCSPDPCHSHLLAHPSHAVLLSLFICCARAHHDFTGLSALAPRCTVCSLCILACERTVQLLKRHVSLYLPSHAFLHSSPLRSSCSPSPQSGKGGKGGKVGGQKGGKGGKGTAPSTAKKAPQSRSSRAGLQVRAGESPGESG